MELSVTLQNITQEIKRGSCPSLNHDDSLLDYQETKLSTSPFVMNCCIIQTTILVFLIADMNRNDVIYVIESTYRV